MEMDKVCLMASAFTNFFSEAGKQCFARVRVGYHSNALEDPTAARGVRAHALAGPILQLRVTRDVEAEPAAG